MPNLNSSKEVQFVDIKDNETNRCERCKFYLMIDSGYGYCRRFPPQQLRKKKKFKIEYPITEWCRIACGEFISKSNFTKKYA